MSHAYNRERMTILRIWEERLAQIVQPDLGSTTLAAFNVNIDAMVRIDPEWVEKLSAQVAEHEEPLRGDTLPRSVESVAELVALLHAAMQTGKSHYGFLADGTAAWCRKHLQDSEFKLGGQAGIIADLMATLGADSRLYTTLLSRDQADCIDPKVRVPVMRHDGLAWDGVRNAADPNAATKVNWIFEYSKGLTCNFPQGTITTPRANRVILSTSAPGSYSKFLPPFIEHLPELGADVDVAFMAGYHRGDGDVARTEAFIAESCRQLQGLKERNKDLVVHIEYVPARDPSIERAIWEGLAGSFDSFGINEHELAQLLLVFGEESASQAIRENENAVTVWQGARALQKILRVPRIHVHNLGYYVLLLDRDYPSAPENVRDSCILASTANAAKAVHGDITSVDQVVEAARIPFSDIGAKQLRAFAEGMHQAGTSLPDDFTAHGIAPLDGHTALIVPAHVVPNPVSTVGMGDTISSVALASEVAARRGEAVPGFSRV